MSSCQQPIRAEIGGWLTNQEAGICPPHLCLMSASIINDGRYSLKPTILQQSKHIDDWPAFPLPLGSLDIGDWTKDFLHQGCFEETKLLGRSLKCFSHWPTLISYKRTNLGWNILAKSLNVISLFPIDKNILQGFYILAPDEGPRSQIPTLNQESLCHLKNYENMCKSMQCFKLIAEMQ